MAGTNGLFRIPPVVYVNIVAIGLAQVVTLVSFVLLLRSIVDSLTPVTVGAAADLQWRWALAQAVLLSIVALLHGWLRAIGFNVAETAGYQIVRDLRMMMYKHLQGITPR